MTQQFPGDMGKELGGKTFDEVFTTNPKIIEFVTTWTDNCTGLFSEFHRYVMARLGSPFEREEHEARCEEFVRGKQNVPKYLIKYVERISLQNDARPDY